MGGLVIFLLLAVVIAGAAALLLRRSAFTPADFTRRTALIFVAVCSLVIGIFLAGEIIADPGGWLAAGLIALWLVPLAALSVLAWYQPGWATVALAILVAAAIAAAIWLAADPAGWRAFEDQRGPLRAVVSFMLTLPAGITGWHRPLTGAILLLALGVLPPAIAAPAGGAALLVVSVPAVLGGLLCLLAALLGRRVSRPVRRGGG